MRSSEFIGIAEKIKSREISAERKIESLKGTISELSEVKASLESRISYLEAALAAAYAHRDSEGRPDYSRIYAIEGQISETNGRRSEVEGQLGEARGELSATETELDRVMEEKAATLFDIQERARKTSAGIASAGGAGADWLGVAASLQNAMRTSMASYVQAAAILDGSVDGAVGGGSVFSGSNSRSVSGSSAGGGSGSSEGPLAAFSSRDSKGSLPPPASKFATDSDRHSAPSAGMGFSSDRHAVNARPPQNFSSVQGSNGYALSAFFDVEEEAVDSAPGADRFASVQGDSGLADNFASRSDTADADENGVSQKDLERHMKWAGQYHVDVTYPKKPAFPKSGTSGTADAQQGPREVGDELEHEISFRRVISGVFGRKRRAAEAAAAAKAAAIERAHKESKAKEQAFLQSIKYDVRLTVRSAGAGTKRSAGADDDDDMDNIPMQGKQLHGNQHRVVQDDNEREESIPEGNEKNPAVRYTRHITHGTRNIIADLVKKNADRKAAENRSIANAQKMIDDYCRNDLAGVLSEEKQKVRLSDTVEFQDKEVFAAGYGGTKNPDYINGYNNGKKSYVKNNGPHPLKTAIHEHNHQLSCNDVTDKSGKVTERRRGVSINGKNRELNEAITEYFTKKTMGADYPKKPNVAYFENMLVIEKMASAFGEDTLKTAYYQNKPELLKEKYESVMGAGTWNAFARAFEMARKSEAAADYIGAMANIFMEKSKGVGTW